MDRLAPALPVAGALIGLVGALALVVALALSLTDLVAAILATAALLAATGAMHEDALSDVADGFGGGSTVEAKLEIMKDPRLGAYGASALALALLLRVALLTGLVGAAGSWGAGAAMIGAAAFSRIAGTWPLAVLSPARPSGLGAVGAAMDRASWRKGAAIGFVIAALAGILVAPVAGALIAPIAAFACVCAVTALARRQIGGQTGDVCGAATILAELSLLLVLLASARF